MFQGSKFNSSRKNSSCTSEHQASAGIITIVAQEQLDIWYSYSIETIVFIVFKQYMIYFEYNVGNFGQAMAVPLPMAL